MEEDDGAAGGAAGGAEGGAAGGAAGVSSGVACAGPVETKAETEAREASPRHCRAGVSSPLPSLASSSLLRLKRTCGEARAPW